MKGKDDLFKKLCAQVDRLKKSEQKAKLKLEKTLQQLKKQGEIYENKLSKKVAAVQKQFKRELEGQVLRGIKRNAHSIAKLAEKVERKTAAKLKQRKTTKKSK